MAKKKANALAEGAVITDRFSSKKMAAKLTAPESETPNDDSGWLADLQQDNLFVDAKIVELKDILSDPEMKVKSGISRALISEGEIVNIVSPGYGHLPNETFFIEAERKLIEADIKYATRTINRRNRSFVADYILNDPSYHVAIKAAAGKEGDKIMPMLRFHNSYDGGPAWALFGFFRAICANGLMLAQMKIGFKCRHKRNVTEVVMPQIGELVQKFMDNEYYTLMKKFEVLAERPITDLNEFVKYTATKMDLFKYEKSEKNPGEPSAAAQIVIDTIRREAGLLGTEPTLWLGYNAFNEAIHKGLKPFARQRKLDQQLFDIVAEMAN